MNMIAKIVWVVVALLIIGGVGYWILQSGGQDESIRTVVAERGDVVQDVAFTGSLTAERSVDMGFEAGGTVAEVLVKVGEAVDEGDALVRLDSRLANLELAKARADQNAAEEQKLLALSAAQSSLAATKAENARLLEKRRQAVRDAKAEIDQQQNVFNETDVENGDSAATEGSLLTLKAKETAYHAAQQALEETLKTVEKTNQAKRDAVTEAQAVYDATVESSGQVAGLSSLEALEALASVKLSKTVLSAPFSGVVTAQEVEVGEFVAAGSHVASVQTVGLDDLELTADVPETDAAKLFSGALATVTFDAYGSSEKWSAEMIDIAPAARIIEGVPTFEVTLQLISSDERFKPGLTSNITVHAAERKGVVSVPRRAVVESDGRQFVRVKDPSTGSGQVAITEVDVTTGLLGSDGRIEITSGLNGGEEVVISNGAA